MPDWKFYGRTHQLADIEKMLARNRWFFAKVSGRRRIGKTALIQEAMRGIGSRKPVFYVQIPDSEPAGVLSSVTDALQTFEVPAAQFPRPTGMHGLARLFESMAEAGYILILDEFQYFNRKGYEEFCSHLQAVVDRLAGKSNQVPGGLIVLGSIHAEMMALLDDRRAPLYNRVTDTIDLQHLDIASILSLLRDHTEPTPQRLLFLWNLFEGVPKFYRDCYEQNVLDSERKVLLRRIFFESSSPLRTEADNWFLNELRGRYDVLLKFVARQPGCMHKELVNAVREASGSPDTQIGSYLRTLIERFALIEGKLPIFAKPQARRTRYYITDNFLCSWLAALANPVSAIAFRPLDGLIDEADFRLAESEGRALEKLVGQLYEERSRRGVGDFALTERVCGFWDKSGIEIDLVAVNEHDRAIRFGSCKRSPGKLIADVNNFNQHVQKFLRLMPKYQGWKTELAGIAPLLNDEERKTLLQNNVIPQDLNDLTAGLE